MARLHEQVLVLKISKLIKDRDTEVESLVDGDFIANAEAVLQELVGDSCIIEVVSDL
jgi:hypothetical protein